MCDNYTFIFYCDTFKIFSSGKRTSSRLRDPEVAAKHKAFLAKVNVATNGSMDSYLKASQLGETSNCIRGGWALGKDREEYPVNLFFFKGPNTIVRTVPE